jgi:tetratricopeptide (TPR) repeat protein
MSAEMCSAIGATRLAEKAIRRASTIAFSGSTPSRIASVYSTEASIAERKGDKTEAIALLKKAVEVAPATEGAAVYHCELGMLYKTRGDNNSAVFHFTEALRLLGPDVSDKYKARVQAELHECRKVSRNE